jgi:hypothetical protein
VAHSLPALPDSLLPQTIAALEAFAAQAADTNVALRAGGLLWDVADEVARSRPPQAAAEALRCAFAALSRLAGGDARPEVRNSCARALCAALQAHDGRREALQSSLLPALRSALRQAAAEGARVSDEASQGGDAGRRRTEPLLLVHHSRDTAAKQWQETVSLCAQGLQRLLRSPDALAPPPDRAAAAEWLSLAQLLAEAARQPSKEVAPAALAALAALASAAAAAAQPQLFRAALTGLCSLCGTASHAPLRAEAPLQLQRLYAAHGAAFDAADARALLLAADAAAEAPDGSVNGGTHGGSIYGEPLAASQRAALELLRSLPPFPPRLQQAGLYTHLLRLLACTTEQQCSLVAARSDAAFPDFGAHATALLAELLRSAPPATRLECLPEALAAAQAAAATRAAAPQGPLWRGGLTALGSLFRECPLWLAQAGGGGLLGGSAQHSASWRALVRAAEASLSPEAAAALPASSEDERLLQSALASLIAGSLRGPGAQAAPQTVLEDLVALLQAGAACEAVLPAATPQSEDADAQAEQAPQAARQMARCHLAALAGLCEPHAEAAATAAAAHRVASLALPAMLDLVCSLVSMRSAKEEPNANSALAAALRAMQQLRPSSQAQEAALAWAAEAGRPEAAACRLLRGAKAAPAARHELGHLLLLYSPLLEALSSPDAGVREGAAALLALAGCALGLVHT